MFGTRKNSAWCPVCIAAIEDKKVWHVCSECGGWDRRRLRLGNKCETKGCNGRYTGFACHNCLSELPRTLLDKKVPKINVMLLASDTGGQSSYVAAVIEDVIKHKDLFGWKRIVPLSDLAIAMQEEYRETLYREKRILPAIDPARSPVAQWKMENDNGEGLVLTVFDFYTGYTMMGETEESKIVPAKEEAIQAADLIIILLDPLRIEELMEHIPSEEAERNETFSPVSKMTDIIDGYRIYLQRMLGTGERRIKTPVAFVINKADVLDPAMQGSRFAAEYESDETDVWEKEEAAVENLLSSLPYDIRGMLDVSVEHWKFFISSNYGLSPLGKRVQLSDAAAPHRVLDPLLWYMRNEGVLRSSK